MARVRRLPWQSSCCRRPRCGACCWPTTHWTTAHATWSWPRCTRPTACSEVKLKCPRFCSRAFHRLSSTELLPLQRSQKALIGRVSLPVVTNALSLRSLRLLWMYGFRGRFWQSSPAVQPWCAEVMMDAKDDSRCEACLSRITVHAVNCVVSCQVVESPALCTSVLEKNLTYQCSAPLCSTHSKSPRTIRNNRLQHENTTTSIFTIPCRVRPAPKPDHISLCAADAAPAGLPGQASLLYQALSCTSATAAAEAGR